MPSRRGRMEKKAVEIVGTTGAPGTPQSLPCAPPCAASSLDRVQLSRGQRDLPSTAAEPPGSMTGPGKGQRLPQKLLAPALPRLAVWALERGPGTGLPRARSITLGQPSSQPVCARPSGSQQSRSGRLGWRRWQDWPGSQHSTDLFPQFIWPPPHTPKQYGPASRRREVGNKPPPKQL